MEHSNIAINIKLAGDLIEKKANSKLVRYNITLSQARILLALFQSKADSISLKALEKLFSVSQATMQGTISRLAKKGLVNVQFLAADKKTKYVSLTSAGEFLADSLGKHIEEINCYLTQSLSDAEISQLNIILAKICKSLND
ncbi:MAG: MarR family transcriptional regulator [Ruminococcaceae bacterium]|nr:MarR family transcriptional regulator [Oscillospiraceae bacterium]